MYLVRNTSKNGPSYTGITNYSCMSTINRFEIGKYYFH